MKFLLRCVWLMVISANALAAGKIDHLEPSSWWIGMHNPQVQLMLHGNDIATLTAQVDYPGVTVNATHKTDNANYLFIDLTISPDTQPGAVNIQLLQAGKLVSSQPFTLHQRSANSAQRQGFGPKDSIYLITPDRFANGDLSNDQVDGLVEGADRHNPDGRHGGDIQGIIDHLDYIAEMGFTQIWLNPLVENAMPAGSYHGYAATDLYHIDPRFGSNALYQQLSHLAAKQGIGLIMDVVPNHIGSSHWWMQDMPAKDWINHQGKFVQTTHRREALRDPHGVAADRKAHSDGWFVNSMPDLNQRNPLLANYLIQNAIWWIEYAGLSGLRIDTYSYSKPAFLSEYAKRILAEYPKLNLVGEEWSLNPAIVAYWQHETPRQDGYQSYMPSMFDFPLQAAVVNGLNHPETWGTGIKEIYQSLANDFIYGNPANLTIMPDNHDMSRILTQLHGDVALDKMAMILFATTRGIPQFFYGTEILMANPGTDAHGIIRTDFPGGWPDDKVNAFNGTGLTAEQTAFQQWFKALLNWRKKSDAVRQGKLTQYTPEDDLYVYFRQTGTQNSTPKHGQTVMVLLNKGEQRKVDLTRYALMIGSAIRATDIFNGKVYSLVEPINIGAKTGLILQWEAQ